ncbi:MAG TPA: hypothetical protein VK509_02910, partial [Polyangiales bacterium]|nr:hypothetical protein [Polyangiales bacterium]
MVKSVMRMLVLFSAGWLAAACGSSGEPAPAAEANAGQPPAQAALAASKPAAINPAAGAQPVQHPDPSLPVAKRILGKWRM